MFNAVAAGAVKNNRGSTPWQLAKKNGKLKRY
jgi:hypothetical protein